jgi:hypothetical protein
MNESHLDDTSKQLQWQQMNDLYEHTSDFQMWVVLLLT